MTYQILQTLISLIPAFKCSLHLINIYETLSISYPLYNNFIITIESYFYKPSVKLPTSISKTKLYKLLSTFDFSEIHNISISCCLINPLDKTYTTLCTPPKLNILVVTKQIFMKLPLISKISYIFI